MALLICKVRKEGKCRYYYDRGCLHAYPHEEDIDCNCEVVCPISNLTSICVDIDEID